MSQLTRPAAALAILCGGAWIVDFALIAAKDSSTGVPDDVFWLIGLFAFVLAPILGTLAATTGSVLVLRIPAAVLSVVLALALFTAAESGLDHLLHSAGNVALRKECGMLTMGLFALALGTVALRRVGVRADAPRHTRTHHVGSD